MSKTALFDLVSHLQKARRTITYSASILYILNLVIHLQVYLAMPLIHKLPLKDIVTSPTPLIILSIFTLLIIGQIVFYLAKKRELYLTHQLMLFRFLIAPLLSLALLQAASTKQLPLSVALIILILTKTLSSLLSKVLLYQAHRHYTLSVVQTSIVAQLDIFQTLLIANVFVTTLPLQFVFAFLTLGSAALTAYKHFIRMESEDIEYRILHLGNTLHIIFSLYYLLLTILTSLQPGYFFLSLLPFLPFPIFAAYTKFRSTKDNLEKALLSELSFDEFVGSIDCFLILTRADFSSHNRRLANYIYSIVSKHGEKCLLAGCELKNQSTQEELKLMTTKNMQQLIHKIMRKIEWILEHYHHCHSEDIRISFALLKFYGEYYPCRMSMQSLINEIKEQELEVGLECQLSNYRALCMGINNIDSIEVEKDDQIYLQFKNVMVSTLNCIIQFWREFNEEKVDLSKIMQIAAKLFPFKARVDQIFQQQLQLQKFTAFQILKLYAEYSHKILKKVQFATKVEDLLSILGNWLKDKQDIHYLSKESQAGIIIISLSESKLGDIFMVNERACDIFHYPKKQMLGLRVNAIMPSLFADIHDRILMDFLKKKRKKYNTDQRLLFGKDGNGYMFPVKLQLQRASYSAKDEYIFIASISPEKVRSAPMYCIVDHQGEITDCTASFRNIFFSKSKRVSSRSIQDIIPGYFQAQSSEQTTEVRYFTSFIRNKKLGQIQVKFEISPIMVKSQHQGYLVKMAYENQRTVSAYKNLRFTDNLRSLLQKSSVQGRQTHYNQSNNSYQLQKLAHRMAYKVSSPQFTLPYLNYEDVQIFANSTDVKQYGRDIKTIRYVGNHFQRIDQDDSFHSESFENEDKVDIKVKIEQLKHRFDHKEQKSTTAIYKVTVNIVIAIVIILGLALYTIYQGEVEEELVFLSNLNKQKQVLYYLPEYVVSFTCVQAGINPEYFAQHLLQIKPILIENFQHSNLQQQDKENIMKIIYLKSADNLDAVFQSSAFVLPESDLSVGSTLKVMWGIMAAISIALVVMFAFMFCHLNYAFLNIYTVFLSINDSSIKKIEDSCKWLIDQIYCTSQGSIEKEQPKLNEDDGNEIEKIKQFKNSKRSQDLFVFIKIALPLLLITAFLIAMLVASNNQFTLYLGLKNQHSILLKSMPASSIELAKVVLKVTKSMALGVDNKYQFYYQQIERTILHFNQNTKQSQFLDSLFGNICTSSASVKSSTLITCNALGNGVLKSGIASTVNFIAMELKNSLLSGKMSASTIDLLFTLHFLFVNPALMTIEDRMEEMLIGDIRSFGSIFSWMIVVLVCLLLGFDVYLFWFPLKTIDMQIELTNEMISLMPDNAGVDTPSA